MTLTSRLAHLPPGLVALTATARGMEGGSMARAAREAFAELCGAVESAGLMPRVRSCLSLCPDTPRGADDPDCRYVAGFVFGHALAEGQGTPEQPALPLGGTLAWWPLQPGPCRVYLHRGPYDTLGRTWQAIRREGLPAGATPRDAPPMELVLNDPETTAPQDLLTEVWIPVQEAAA